MINSGKNLLYPKQIYGVMSIHNDAIFEYVLLIQCHVLYAISSKAESALSSSWNDFWWLLIIWEPWNKMPVNAEYIYN